MSLQDLCLKRIVEDFERYYSAFSTTENADLKRMFEFLQRIYSFQIASRLDEEFIMKDKYIDFVINKYLKILYTEWFKDCPWKTVAAKIAEVGPSVEKLYIHECSEEMPWQDILCHLPNLEKVSCHHDCTDEIFNNIAKFCPNIIEIDAVDSVAVSDEGLLFLYDKEIEKAPCPKLKRILIGSCQATELGVQHLLENLPLLELIEHYELPVILYAMHAKDVHKLDKMQPYNLTKLDLLYSSVFPFFNDLLKICLTLCPRLKSLSCPVVQKQNLEILSGLAHLEKLDLEYQQDDGSLDINNFLKSNGVSLTSLTIVNCSLSILILARSCPCLKKLCVNNIKCDDHDDSVPKFCNLESFVVDNSNSSTVKDPKLMCKILSSSPKLEVIALRSCTLNSFEVKTQILKCCELCSIKEINFGSSVVDKKFVIDILLSCPSLRCFNLEDCDLDSDEMDEIYKCAEILPNSPDIYFGDQLSISDYDDFFDDYYDNDDDDEEEYDDDDDEYDDYLDTYDEVDEQYGYFF